MKNYFTNISMTGRIAYGIMCFESLIKDKYPDYNWDPLLLKLWDVTSAEYWDEWASMFIEYIPEYMLEFPTYEESDFEFIKKEEYNALKPVYDSVDESVNEVLKLIRDIEEVYAFSSIPKNGAESINILVQITEILKENNVSLPELTNVEGMTFDKRNGWGDLFDGTKLSIILNR